MPILAALCLNLGLISFGLAQAVDGCLFAQLQTLLLETLLPAFFSVLAVRNRCGGSGADGW